VVSGSACCAVWRAPHTACPCMGWSSAKTLTHQCPRAMSHHTTPHHTSHHTASHHCVTRRYDGGGAALAPAPLSERGGGGGGRQDRRVCMAQIRDEGLGQTAGQADWVQVGWVLPRVFARARACCCRSRRFTRHGRVQLRTHTHTHTHHNMQTVADPAHDVLRHTCTTNRRPWRWSAT
jgi:hypothetical protein